MVVIDKPMVSVCMITYKHESFIQQAIESVLVQQTNFDYELIVANDNSPDTTDEIIKNIIATHQDAKKIKYIHHNHNLGITPNFIYVLKRATGKYIAYCEGDDYWIDPYKLQKQVDFLEQHKNFSAIATNSLVKYEGIDTNEHLFRKSVDRNLGINDLLEGRHFHTATFMFRQGVFKDDFPKHVLSADRTLFLLASCFGDIKLFEDVTAVYRKNDGGISRKVTSKQMKLDYHIPSYIRKYDQEFDYYKLNRFVSKTVLEYSFKIYFSDFLKASYMLIYYNFKNSVGKANKLRDLKQSLKLIYTNLHKVVL